MAPVPSVGTFFILLDSVAALLTAKKYPGGYRNFKTYMERRHLLYSKELHDLVLERQETMIVMVSVKIQTRI